MDRTISKYILEEQAWKFGSGGEIYNQHGEKVGSIKRKPLSMKSVIALFDLDEKLVCMIKKKEVGSQQIYEVEKPNGDLIGKARTGIESFIGYINMYDSEEKHIFRVHSRVNMSSFKITDPEDRQKVYAEIERVNMIPNKFAEVEGEKSRFSIHIKYMETERILLLSYAIMVYDFYKKVDCIQRQM